MLWNRARSLWYKILQPHNHDRDIVPSRLNIITKRMINENLARVLSVLNTPHKVDCILICNYIPKLLVL